jgi:hypothetical protein
MSDLAILAIVFGSILAYAGIAGIIGFVVYTASDTRGNSEPEFAATLIGAFWPLFWSMAVIDVILARRETETLREKIRRELEDERAQKIARMERELGL